MTAIILVVFVAVFAVAALLMTAVGTGPSKPVRQRLEALGQVTPPPSAEMAPDIRRKEHLSGVGWLNRWMIRMNLAPALRRLLYQADVRTPPEKLLLISLTGWLLIAMLIEVRIGSMLPAFTLAAPFVPVPLFWVFHQRAKRFARFEQQFPEAIDMLVSALKVGHSLATAIGAVGQDCEEPLAGEFRKLFDEENFGLDMRAAMTNLAGRVPLQNVRIFVAAALIQKESGGNLAEVLEKVAHTTRETFRLKKQIRVHTAQGRLTGIILSVLPVALGFGMYLVNPGGMSVLWTSPVGRKMLTAAVAMIITGCLIIRHIVRVRV